MTPDFLSLEEAVARVLAEVRPLEAESVALADAAGRVLREPIVATHDLPPEPASLMDGYAVRAGDVASNRSLTVAFEIAAGHVAPRALGPGECARIFTGAVLPAGSDAVIRQEDATRDDDVVSFAVAPKEGEHVRAPASDARRGETLAPAGGFVDAGVLALAATAGHARLSVGRAPVVKIVATGDELVVPGEELPRGKVHESNSRMLARFASEAGAITRCELAPDEPSVIARALTDADVLVTTGGASVGDFDFAREVLERIGGRKIFWQVAIRPGKPVLFGVSASAGRRALYFALPGNPGAAALTFDLFVRPALLAMQGASRPRRPRVTALLAEAMKKPKELTLVSRGRLVSRDATLFFEPARLQGSMSVGSLARLGAVALLPAGSAVVEAGARVEVEPWGPVEA